MTDKDNLIFETTNMINALNQKCKELGILWDTLRFYKIFTKELSNIYLNLTKIVGEPVNWRYYLNKQVDGKDINPSDLKRIIDSIEFREITFIFPLYGLPVTERIDFDQYSCIESIQNLDDFSIKIDEKYKSGWNKFKSQGINVLCITTRSEVENDANAYSRSFEKATYIINFLNFCLKNISLKSNLINFGFLPLYRRNSYFFSYNKSPFILEDKIIRENKIKGIIWPLTEIPFNNKELFFDEEVDVKEVKGLYTKLIDSKNSLDKTIIRVISLVSDSVTETNLNNKFIKLISAYDFLLARRLNPKPIKVQLEYNSLFIIDIRLLDDETISKFKYNIEKGYEIRSALLHEGKNLFDYENQGVKVSQIYKDLLCYLRKIIFSLLKSDRFSEISNVSAVFTMIDEQVKLGEKSLACKIVNELENVSEDHFSNMKNIKRKVKKAIEKNTTPGYIMYLYDQHLSNETFSLVFNKVINELNDHKVCEINKFKRIKLVNHNVSNNQRIIEKIYR